MTTLEILIQPPEFNRYRYSTERLNNVLKDKRKYPTVRLRNFSEAEAVIRVTLVERDENGGFIPHTACRLDAASACEIKVSSPLYTAEFNSLKIVILKETKTKGTKKEETKGTLVKKEDKQKNISKNEAYLMFEAFYERDTHRAQPLCEAVSRGVKNEGHVSTKSLSISHVVPTFGKIGSNIVLLITKVKKDEIAVEFRCHQGDFRKMQAPGYVHYQTAVVVQVPDELQEVLPSYLHHLDVEIRLYRPSTETWSDPKTFTVLKPDALVPASDVQSHPSPPHSQSSTLTHSSAQSQSSQEHLRGFTQPLQAQCMPSPHLPASSQHVAPPPYSDENFYKFPFQTPSEQVQLTPHHGVSISFGNPPGWAPTQPGSSYGNPLMPTPTLPWPPIPTPVAELQDVGDTNFLFDLIMEHDGSQGIHPSGQEDAVYACHEYTYNTRSRQREVKKKLATPMGEITSVFRGMSIQDYEERIIQLKKELAQSLDGPTLQEVARRMHCDEKISALGPLFEYMQKRSMTLCDLRNFLAIIAVHFKCEKSVLILDRLIELLRERRRRSQQN